MKTALLFGVAALVAPMVLGQDQVDAQVALADVPEVVAQVESTEVAAFADAPDAASLLADNPEDQLFADGYGDSRRKGYGDDDSDDHKGYGRKTKGYGDDDSDDHKGYGRKTKGYGDDDSDDHKGYGRKTKGYGDDDSDDHKGYGRKTKGYGKDDSDDHKGYGRKTKGYGKDDSEDHKGYGRKTKGYGKNDSNNNHRGYGRERDSDDGYRYHDDYDNVWGRDDRRHRRRDDGPPGRREYQQFWNTVDYCDAELSLSKCLVDCDVIEDFATTKRVTKCINKFTKSLCAKVTDDGCDSGRVHLTKANCTSKAVVAALYTVGEVQRTTIGDDKTPVDLYKADNPDSFTAIKLAVTMQSVINYGNCLSGSLLNYADTCHRESYFGKHTNKCVSKILATCSGKSDGEALPAKAIVLGDILTTKTYNDWSLDALDAKNANPGNTYKDGVIKTESQNKLLEDVNANDETTGQALLQNGYDNSYRRDQEKSRKYVSEHHTKEKPELEKLAALIRNASTVTYRTVPVEINRHHHGVNKAELTVCPNSFTPLNYRLPALDDSLFSPKGGIPKDVASYDFPGFPIHDAAFHFPAQKYNDSTKCWEPARYGTGMANQFAAGTELDPRTPKRGIRDTCEQFHFLSMLAWFAGEDTGDYCFTIDGYTAEFLESDEVRHLDWDQVTNTATCKDKQDWSSQKTKIKQEIKALQNAGATTNVNQLSTNLALDQSVLLGSVVAKPGCASCYKIQWDEPSYCPRHIARFGMKLRCCRSFRHTMKARCKKNKSYKEVACGTYSADWNGACSKSDDLEFTHTVYSEVNKGELQPSTSSYRTNVDGVKSKVYHLFAIFQGALLNLSTAQQALFTEAINYFNWNAKDYRKNSVFCLDRPTRLAWRQARYDDDDSIYKHDRPRHNYFDGNSWCENANSLLHVKINWGSLIGLSPADGKCFAPTCMVSRYVTCSEQNATESSGYGKNKSRHYELPYADNHRSDKSYKRSLLAASAPSSTNLLLMSIGGFVAGVAAVAVGQFVWKSQRATDVSTTPYQQQLL